MGGWPKGLLDAKRLYDDYRKLKERHDLLEDRLQRAEKKAGEAITEIDALLKENQNILLSLRQENQKYTKLDNLYQRQREDNQLLRKEVEKQKGLLAAVNNKYSTEALHHDQTRQKYESELDEERLKHKDQLEQAKLEYMSEVKTLEKENQDRLRKLRLEQDQKQQEYEEKTTDLTRKHRQEEIQFKKELQSRNRALVARETTSSISDGEIKAEFVQIAAEVDEWAREKWRFNRSGWTDELQLQITNSPKRLQKKILQDSIWMIFYEHIFGSPFRVFGKEGKILEEKWQEAFGTDPRIECERYVWPEPSFDAELWRYNTMRPCQKALDVATSEYDHRSKLRTGWEETLQTIQKKLIETFELVTILDQKQKQGLYELAKRMSKLWILFGTQRCRLLVVMHDLVTCSEAQNSQSRKQQSTEFVLRPEVRRIGDADGESLDKQEVVQGCRGEVERITYGISADS